MPSLHHRLPRRGAGLPQERCFSEAGRTSAFRSVGRRDCPLHRSLDHRGPTVVPGPTAAREQRLRAGGGGERRACGRGSRASGPAQDGGRGVKCGTGGGAVGRVLSPKRGAPFDVGVRQGLPLPPLHTRAHAHTHTRTRTTLCRQGSGGSKVTGSPLPHPSSRAEHPSSFHLLARALQPPRPGRGQPPAEARRSPFHASLLTSATRGRGGPEEERPGGRPGGRARAHTKGRSERRAASAAGRPPDAPCCAPWRTRAASCCPTPAACSRTPCPARPLSSTSNR